jgi:hypothetical protein
MADDGARDGALLGDAQHSSDHLACFLIREFFVVVADSRWHRVVT